MIKAEELRIGNWINDIDESFYKIRYGHDIDGSWNPITLTEDILIKAGFVNYKHQYSLNDGSCNDHWELNGKSYWILYFLKDGRFSINEAKLLDHRLSHNRYVHQLQNLYFALTGTELNIQL